MDVLCEISELWVMQLRMGTATLRMRTANLRISVCKVDKPSFFCAKISNNDIENCKVACSLFTWLL